MDAKVKRFAAHARRHGTEEVLEAGSQAGLTLAQLVELQKELDKIVDAKCDQFGTTAKKRRLSAEARVKRHLGIEDDVAA